MLQPGHRSRCNNLVVTKKQPVVIETKEILKTMALIVAMVRCGCASGGSGYGCMASEVCYEMIYVDLSNDRTSSGNNIAIMDTGGRKYHKHRFARAASKCVIIPPKLLACSSSNITTSSGSAL